jgi:hypothetical protein
MEYSLSQTSLEQVSTEARGCTESLRAPPLTLTLTVLAACLPVCQIFNNFASKQKAETGVARGIIAH